MLRTWADVVAALASLLGGGEEAEACVLEWLREAVRARYGSTSLHTLPRAHRQLAFQKTLGTLYDLQEVEGDLAFDPDIRRTLQAVFARRWDGLHLEGPPWRLSPAEQHLPPHHEWVRESDFSTV